MKIYLSYDFHLINPYYWFLYLSNTWLWEGMENVVEFGSLSANIILLIENKLSINMHHFCDHKNIIQLISFHLIKARLFLPSNV